MVNWRSIIYLLLISIGGIRVAAQTSISPQFALNPVDRTSAEFQALAALPDLSAIPAENVLLMYRVPIGGGECVLELPALPLYGVNPERLAAAQAAGRLVLYFYRARADADAPAWLEYPYLYDAYSESLTYQCAGAGVFALVEGEPVYRFNAGLSDAGGTTTSPLVALWLIPIGLGTLGAIWARRRVAAPTPPLL